MSRSALLIGGTGQIGHAAAVALERDGYDVVVAHRGRSRPAAAAPGRMMILDREDTGALLTEAQNHDVVVDVVPYSRSHAEQLSHLAGRVGSLIVISTGSVYLGQNGSYFDIATSDETYPEFPVPITESAPTIDNDAGTYGPMKSAMERSLLAVPDLPVSILRPAAVHGPLSPKLREWYFIKRVMDKRPHIVLARNGESRFSTSSTLNVAALIARCAQHPGKRVLNAVDEENYTTRQQAAAVFGVMGHEAEIVGLDGPPIGDLGATPWDAPKPFVCSMQRARDEVGYVAAVTYEESIRADLEWLDRALADAARRGETWHELFPSVVSRYGADGWFPYDAEDAWIVGHATP